MKQKINLFILISLIAGLSFNSCTNGFDAINTNPDRTTTAQPEYIFGLSTVAAFRALSGNVIDVNSASWYIFGNYSNQWSVIGGSGPHFGPDGHGDIIWNNLYTSAILPCNNIVRDYGDNPAYTNRVAIAKIWRSYLFSQIVGLYGPCPYTNACNGAASIPYDNEETVYRGILQELKDAYTAMNLKGDVYPAAAEPFLASDISRWNQFAHCIRLRTAIRLTEVPDTWAPGLANDARAIVAEELNNAENGQLITNNTGNFYMTFGQDVNNQNPLYRQVVANPQLLSTDPGQYPVIHESLSLWMGPNTYNDPCLDVYMTPGSGGTRPHPLPLYLGRPHSFDMPQNYHAVQGWSSPYSSLKYGDYATIGTTFSKMLANFYFFSYPELCFIRAEAVLKGYWTGSETAEQYYYDGIAARCSKYGITGAAVTTYENSPGIHWSTPTDTTTNGATVFRDYLGGIVSSILGGEEDNFKRIIVQHWISLFSQNIDIYTLLRRTEVIPFKPNFGPDQNAYVNALYAFTPERLIYPGSELSINTKETQNAILNYLFDNTLKDPQDRVTFRLIYAKDNPGLPAPDENSVAYAAFPYPLPNMAKNRQQ